MPTNDRAYQAEYRARRPDYVQRLNDLNKARRLAFEELRKRHLDEYNKILAGIKVNMKLDQVQS